MGFKKYGQSGWDKIDAVEIIKEYGVEINFSRKNEAQVRLIKYFKMDDGVEKMYDYILDSLTFIFLRNLGRSKMVKKELGGDGRLSRLVTKILNDASLKLFYKRYQSDAQRTIRGTIS